MRDNPETIIRSGFYIYNTCVVLFSRLVLSPTFFRSAVQGLEMVDWLMNKLINSSRNNLDQPNTEFVTGASK